MKLQAKLYQRNVYRKLTADLQSEIRYMADDVGNQGLSTPYNGTRYKLFRNIKQLVTLQPTIFNEISLSYNRYVVVYD